MDITEPLILSAGSHEPGTGRGCAMNVIAWELGGEITDYPAGVHRGLARCVQWVNDRLAVPTGPAPESPDQPEYIKVYKRTIEMMGFGYGSTDEIFPVHPISLPVEMDLVLNPSPGVAAAWEAYHLAHAQWQREWEVPAAYSGRLLDIAHRTLGTDVVHDRDHLLHLTPGWTYGDDELFSQFTHTALVAGVPRHGRVEGAKADILLIILAATIESFRKDHEVPEVTAPSLDVVNDALRKMATVS